MFKVTRIEIEGELPENCHNKLTSECFAYNQTYSYCRASKGDCPPTGRRSDCPLVQSTGFKVGDRVRVKRGYGLGGAMGTIVEGVTVKMRWDNGNEGSYNIGALEKVSP